MVNYVRSWLIGTLSIVVIVAALLGGNPHAEAKPPASPPDGSTSRAAVTLSKTQWRAAGYVTTARNRAISASGSTMDYRTMKKVFGVKNKLLVDWRRQMAAGFRQAGGNIRNISKAENRAVEKRRKEIYGKRKPLGRSILQSFPDSPSCRGKSGKVVVNKHESHTYFNSCQTDDITYAWGGCIATMAAISRWTSKKPKLDIPRYLIAGFCTLQLGVVKRAQGQSALRAIYVRMYQEQTYIPYPSGLRYYIEYTIRPQ